MGVEEYLRLLALANRHGWAFLAAYGTTWALCALAWARLRPRAAALLVMAQGMVALPAALVLTAVTSGPPRPDQAELNALSITMATSQLLGLPVVIYLFLSGRYALVPLGLVAIVVVHFGPYSWLYQTPLYVVMGTAIAVSAATAMRRSERDAGPGPEVGARRVCLSTGGLMLAGSVIALLL